MSSESTKRQKA